MIHMKRKDRVYEFLRRMKAQQENDSEYTAGEIAEAIGSSRANVSSDLNRLLEERLVEKSQGRPVRYKACAAIMTSMPTYSGGDSQYNLRKSEKIFKAFIGYDGSLRTEVEKAKAGILYPPWGLSMLIVGETGVGKSMFAKLLFEYAKEMGRLKQEAMFVAFNCADYAANPQLLLSQLFGHIKGAFTGADRERQGLVEKADGGILFLDEVHRLPPEAQEMLFTVMDYGRFRKLGEADQEHFSHPLIILATTDIQNKSLLATFKRRIPIDITIPALSERNVYERLKLVEEICKAESSTVMLPVRVDSLVMKALIAYHCPGNVGQLKNDIKVICARAYVQTLIRHDSELHITVQELAPHIKLGLSNIDKVYSDINLIVSNFVYWPENEEGLRKESGQVYDYISGQLNRAIQGERFGDVKENLMAAIELFCFGESGKNDGRQLNPQVFLTADIIHLVNYADQLIRSRLAVEMTGDDQKVLALLLSTTKQRLSIKYKIRCPFLDWIRTQASRELNIAAEIVEAMGSDCEDENKINGAGFIAGFLMEVVKKQTPMEGFCGVFVIGRGEGAAQGAAKVANEILDREFVGWYDGLCEKISPQEEVAVKKAAAEYFQGNGGLILYGDISLQELAEEIKKSLGGEEIYTLGNIQTSFVIEAGIAAYEMRSTPFCIFERLNYMALERQGSQAEKGQISVKKTKNKVVVTACVSGLGIALKMKQMIEKKYVLFQDIKILAMDIFSQKEFKKQIITTQKDSEILCIIGLDIGMDLGIPYISANDFILGRGEEYFLNLLKNSNVFVEEKREKPEEKGDYEKALIQKNYFSSFLHYLNSETLVPYVEDSLKEMELTFGKLEPGKRIVLLVHICCMAERLLFGASRTPDEEEKEMGVKEKKVLESALRNMAEAYGFVIPDYEYQMIEKILDMDFNE